MQQPFSSIKIPTRLRGVLVIFLYLVWFSLCLGFYWELKDKEVEKKNAILSLKPLSQVRILIYRRWAIGYFLFIGNETKRMQTRSISRCLISQSAQKLHEPLVCQKYYLSRKRKLARNSQTWWLVHKKVPSYQIDNCGGCGTHTKTLQQL